MSNWNYYPYYPTGDGTHYPVIQYPSKNMSAFKIKAPLNSWHAQASYQNLSKPNTRPFQISWAGRAGSQFGGNKQYRNGKFPKNYLQYEGPRAIKVGGGKKGYRVGYAKQQSLGYNRPAAIDQPSVNTKAFLNDLKKLKRKGGTDLQQRGGIRKGKTNNGYFWK
jgi:hypothetical protein